MMEPETEYLMIRAREEAVLAIQAEHPAAAAAHQNLSVRYSAKAAIELADAASENAPLSTLPPRRIRKPG